MRLSALEASKEIWKYWKMTMSASEWNAAIDANVEQNNADQDNEQNKDKESRHDWWCMCVRRK